MSGRGRGVPLRRSAGAGGVAGRRELRVFTEGVKTEVQYLRYWERLHRGSVSLLIDDFHGTPLPLVRHAVEQQKRDRREDRGGRGRAPSATWCVFDIDQHPNLPEAVDLARSHSIHLAISNPCVELWFLLHFAEQTAWIHRHDAQREAARFLSGGKALSSSDWDALRQRYDLARARAQGLATRHRGDGDADGENPSSGVWRLVDVIRGGGGPAGV